MKLLAKLDGHTRTISSIAFSPDGSHAISCSREDISARIWNLEKRSELQRFMGHDSPKVFTTSTVYAGEFTPDGRQAVTVGSDKMARLWNAEDGKEVRAFKAEVDLYSVSISADGRTVVIGGANAATQSCEVWAWNLASGEVIQKIKLPHGVMSVAVSPDGQYAAAAAKGTSLCDLKSGAILRTFREGARYLRFSDDGKRLHAAFPSGRAMTSFRVIHWDVPNGKAVFQVDSAVEASDTELQRTIRQVSLTPDASKAISCGINDTLLRVWDAKTGALLDTHGQNLNPFSAPQDGVGIVTGVTAISRDGTRALTASDKGKTIYYWGL